MAGIRHIFLAGAFACLATGMLLCSCSTGSPAAPESTSSHAEESVPSHEASAPEPASADSAEPVRIGKDQVTVLVLNGCGIEGAAAEVAEKVRAAGFENVTVDNATYFNVPSTRVSYYHEENSAEAEELGDLLKVVGLASVYCYDGDDWAGGWNKDYDILVMVGDPRLPTTPSMSVLVQRGSRNSSLRYRVPWSMRANSSAMAAGDSFIPLSSQQISTL